MRPICLRDEQRRIRVGETETNLMSETGLYVIVSMAVRRPFLVTSNLERDLTTRRHLHDVAGWSIPKEGSGLG